MFELLYLAHLLLCWQSILLHQTNQLDHINYRGLVDALTWTVIMQLYLMQFVLTCNERGLFIRFLLEYCIDSKML